MRILLAHNRYQQAGGEDSVFSAEADLLRGAGHVVSTVLVSNDAIQGAGPRARAALTATYNPQGRRLMARALEEHRPDIVHVHNFFPVLSPAIFDACEAAGVPAVWTLHNFRVTCANGLLFRNGVPCEECVGRLPLPAVRHRCYRDSFAGSAAVAAMIGYHSLAGTWHRKVARFIALTDFAKAVFVASGLPQERIAVKPNFIPDPRPELGEIATERCGAVYVGRLSAEKGIRTLIEAWKSLGDVPLTIIGDGPERAAAEAIAPGNVRFAGWLDRGAVHKAMASAEMLIVPSLWFENFPVVVVEAMALGTPVIASRLGALTSIVTDRVDGRHFAAGDAVDLARIVREVLGDRVGLAALGAGARRTWETLISPGPNLTCLSGIYDSVLEGARGRAAA